MAGRLQFCFLLKLLSIPAGLFDVAFAAADSDGSGTIDVQELEMLVKVKQKKIVYVRTRPLSSISLFDFLRLIFVFVDSCSRALWKAWEGLWTRGVNVGDLVVRTGLK